MKPRILTFASHYLPGFKGGGPIRTMASLVDTLGDEFEFILVTQDRDLGCSEPYFGIEANAWQQIGKAKVCYLSPERLAWPSLRQLISNTPHDILYLNSFFSLQFGILPLLFRRCGLIPKKPTIMAPRGQFSAGALQLKPRKKRAYIHFVKALRLHASLLWQVSSSHEKEDLYTVFGAGPESETKLKVVVASDLPNITHLTPLPARSKKSGTIRIVFLSRISPMKNLAGALSFLSGVKGDVLFDIYGPVEDVAYWKECQLLIDQLPDNIQIRYQGTVAHDSVVQAMATYDLFFLPTLGENYGHVIIEALAAGCLLLISDQTPWRDLERLGIGWDIPLDQQERFITVLQHCVEMSNEEMADYSVRARAYAKQTMADSVAVQQNRDLFLQLL